MNRAALFLGPVMALVVALSVTGLPTNATLTLAITTCCLVWWIGEAMPMGVVALLPVALFPLLGVLDKNQVAQALGSPIILLMLGGFILSRAMERSGSHRQLALIAIRTVGGGTERRLIIGFMIASAALSMWISNTATTLMLLPVALAVVGDKDESRFSMALMLGIAWAASIGGIGTPVGTPPNLIFMQVYEEVTGSTIGFVKWMTWALPVVLLLLPLAMIWLTRGLGNRLEAELPQERLWTTEQKRVMWIFALTITLWITRKEPFGGWSGALGVPGASDATVALMAAIALFAVSDGKGGKLMDWPAASTIPWDILLLFGGGITIAKAFTASGLSGILADQLQMLEVLPLLLTLVVLCLAVTLLTEATSNMATATLLMPVLAAAAAGMGLLPEVLMVPAVISCSCAFMLPIATAPNAIVYGSRQVTVAQMAKEGAVLSVGGALIIGVCGWLILG